MSGRSKVDHALVKYLLVLVGMTLAALLVAEALTDDGTALMTQIIAIVAPVSGLLVLTIKGSEAVQDVREVKEQVTALTEGAEQQAATLNKVEANTNGVLDQRIHQVVDAAVNPRMTRIENALVRIEQRLPPREDAP